MTDLQKTLAEKIIGLHKEKEGVLNWYQLSGYKLGFPEVDSNILIILRNQMVNMGFIEHLRGGATLDFILTQKGWNFTTFEDAEEGRKSSIQRSVEMQNLSLQNLELQNKLLSFELSIRELKKDLTKAQLDTEKANARKRRWGWIGAGIGSAVTFLAEHGKDIPEWLHKLHLG